jgi:hypothetical protein
LLEPAHYGKGQGIDQNSQRDTNYRNSKHRPGNSKPEVLLTN